MELTINGESRELEVAVVADLVSELALPDRGVAIAVDDAVVPRARWTETRLQEQQRIEILTAVQGG